MNAPLLGPNGRAFTAEQSEAIRRRQGSLLLEATAGSGKTSVLVERFVRSVTEDGVPPNRILAITFTEKAAGELRARVRERFVELGERERARETESAWVSTVHGFCARLLRAHAIGAGLDPGFEVLDEAAARALRQDAWDTAFGAWLDGPHGEVALGMAAAYDTDRLRDAVVDAHDGLRSCGQSRPALPPPQLQPDPGPLRDELAAACAAAGAVLLTAGAGKQVGIARDRVGEAAALLAPLGPGEHPAPGPLGELDFKGTAAALKADACVAYLDALQAYRAALLDRGAAEAVPVLDALVGAYADAYAAARAARGALDFDDLELGARDLLRDDAALRRSYAERFDRVMVDEFQDSNPLQVALFGMLDRDTLFCVGDEQQSIYGFRHADVEVFRARRRALAAEGRVATLATSFRSREQILDAVNAVFAPRFGEGFVPLRAGRPLEPVGEPVVELLITDRDGWDEAEVDLGDLPQTSTWRQAEARLLAQRVRDLVASGEAAPEETVVLLRSLGDLPVFERALEDQGLPTLSVGGRGYWGRPVVRDLCGWLAVLANPRDEPALFGVLSSPLVGIGSDALMHLAQAGRKRGVWAAIEAGAGRDRLDAGDRARVEAFAVRYETERALAPRLALDELIRRAVEAAGYDRHVLRLGGGERRLANIHKLERLAAEYERDHGRDVRGLVDRATAELQDDSREADAPVELGNTKAVRLMSIHAAKGLEFDVVCVADLGRRSANDDSADLLVDDDRVGLRLVTLDGTNERTLHFDALRDEARERAAAEEERIVYVAMTRARERLIVSGGHDPEKWPAPGTAAPPLRWLAPALLEGDPGQMATPAEPFVDRRYVRCMLNSPATIGAVLREDALAPSGRNLPPAPTPEPAPGLPAVDGPAPAVRRLSYSALQAHARCGYRFYLERILRLPEVEPPAGGAGVPAVALDPRTRGSLVHALLEEDDPAAGPPDPASVLAAGRALAERHRLELDDAAHAEIAGLVCAFADSPLRERLAAARSIAREHPFAFGLDDALITGFVDVVATERGGAQLVVDYKTDRLAPDADPAAYVAAGYEIQRTVYALAALHSGAAKVEVAYALLERPAEPVVRSFTQDDVPRLQELLRTAAAGPLTGDYPVTQAPHRELCETCPGRKALCSYPEDVTLSP